MVKKMIYQKQFEQNKKLSQDIKNRVFVEIGFVDENNGPYAGEWNDDVIIKLIAWQKENNIPAAPDWGFCGPKTLKYMERQWSEEAKRELAPTLIPSLFIPRELPLITKAAQVEIINHTIRFEGGSVNPYSAMNRDGEYWGLFDRENDIHWASYRNQGGGTHIGLSYGAWQFTQDGGSLGRVMQKAKEIDEAVFIADFGGKVSADNLLSMLLRKGRERINGRSVRVQKLNGFDLWEDYWAEKFSAAGKKKYMREAQNEVVIEKYLSPSVKLAEQYEINSLNEISVMFDISIQFGSGGLEVRCAKAAKITGGPFIERLIRQLPERRRKRRKSILAAASSATFSSLELE